MASDNFSFDLVGTDERPFLGYISSEDPTRVSQQVMVRGSQNAILYNSGNIGPRPGLLRYDPADDTQDPVVSSFDWEDVNGDTLLLRVLGSGSLQFYRTANQTWYTLEDFEQTDFSFAKWWYVSEVKEILVMCNGTPDLYAWSGGTIEGVGEVEYANAAYLTWSLNLTSVTLSTTNVTDEMYVGYSESAGGIVFNENPPDASFITLTSTSTVSALNQETTIVFKNTLSTPPVGTQAQVKIGATLSETMANLLALIADPSGSTAEYAGFSNGDVQDVYDEITAVSTAALSTGDGSTWGENGFIQDGSDIVIDGVSYTYSLIAGNWLINIDVSSSVPTEGSFAYAGIVTTPSTAPDEDSDMGGLWTDEYVNDFLLVLNNQLMTFSYTSRIVRISFSEDYTNFQNSNDFIAGDPDYVILDEFPIGGTTRGDSAYVGAGVSNWYELTPNTEVTYVESVGRLVYTKVTKFVGAGLTAPLGHNFVATLGEDIIFVGQDHQLRTLGFYRNITAQKSPSLSLAVRQELEQEDFTGGQLRSVGEYTYITAPISGNTYLYQIRDDIDSVGNITSIRQWQPFQTWNISRIAVVDGIVHGYSAETPQLYQLWDTDRWDDETSDESVVAPYVTRVRFAYQQIGTRDNYGSFDKIFYEGYILPGSELVSNIYYDYQGSTKIVEADIGSAVTTPVTFGRDGVNLVGESIVGTELIGGGLSDENYPNSMPKFRAIADVKIDACFEFQIELVSTQAGSRWEILCLGSDRVKAPQSPTFIKIGSQVLSN